MKTICSFKILVFLGLAFITTITCDDVDLTGIEAGEVQGFWATNEQLDRDNTFLFISDTEVIYYYFDFSENCLTTEYYDVVRIDDGGFYILNDGSGGENQVLAISYSDGSILVRDIDETQNEIVYFGPSEVDIENFAPNCDPAE